MNDISVGQNIPEIMAMGKRRKYQDYCLRVRSRLAEMDKITTRMQDCLVKGEFDDYYTKQADNILVAIHKMQYEFYQLHKESVSNKEKEQDG